ncbi:hypothetical protein CPB83DRAFT_865434 [Crepidotus variabilis]|uniref:Uncharacterized protein n=1 Tax=Crepidotus variabilis TaxID=179855 RepID=A0A9P6JHU0_9AGAR|nr:hypothetical protein CPB83DRAFT_865434 [Crepidotus variabilis]
MSSPSRNPSILALNRFFKPNAFNTGPPIPNVLPVSLGPSPSGTPSDSARGSSKSVPLAIPARRRTTTPDLTSSPTSSISSLPSTASSSLHSRSSSRSSLAHNPNHRGIGSGTRTGPTPLPLESDHIKQIFAQPLLVDLLAGTTDQDHETQVQDQDLAEKMNVHMNLLNSAQASAGFGFGYDYASNHDQMQGMYMYEVDGGYINGYPGVEAEVDGYFQDAYGYVYAPNQEGVDIAYDPAYAHLPVYQHDSGVYAGQPFDVPQTARPEDYFGFPAASLNADASPFVPPPPPPPSAAFPLSMVPVEFNANPNLNPNAMPFVPSTSSTSSSVSAPASTSTSSYTQAVKAPNAPIHPPGLPTPKSVGKNGLGLDTLVERAQRRLSGDASIHA